MANVKTPVFEENLGALEGIVEQLESGQLSLDDAMKAFEKGISLTRQCQESLATAEQKVQVLMNKNGEEMLQPLPNQGEE
jgi:exodeoxyribonuclease VII small subunit